MSPSAAYPTPPLPIGATIGLTFRIFGRAWGKFIGLIVSLVAVSVVVGLILGTLTVFLPATVAVSPSWHLITKGVGLLCQYAAQIILQSAILFGAAEIMEHGGFKLRDALMVGCRRVLPMAGVIILQILVMVPAFILFIVPGIIVILMLYVAIPACVVERRGPIDSLNRSIALTKGNRWRILAILGLVFLGVLIIGAVLVLIVVLLQTQKALMVGILILCGILVFLPFGVLASILPAAIFFNLKTIHAPEATDLAPWGRSSLS